MTTPRLRFSVQRFGYCSLTPPELADLAESRGPAALASLPGQYVIVLESPADTYLISSPYGMCQYHYAVVDGAFYHGETVLDVLRRAGLPWEWDWQALGDLAHLEYVHNDASLHPRIRRVPPGAILHFQQGRLHTSSLSWEQLHPPSPSRPLEAVAALNAETQRWATPASMIALSAGFDSRVILSSLLISGCRPAVVTMGFPASVDVVVSEMICSRLNLPLTRVQLDIADYLESGSAIAALSNGTEFADHWHAYIFPKKADLHLDTPFFIGSNGEFARSCLFGKAGPLAVTAALLSPLSLYWFWRWRVNMIQVFHKEDLPGLRPELAAEFSEFQSRSRISRLMQMSYQSLLPGYERYYLEQRMRTLLASGLTLTGAHAAWRAPMFSPEWCKWIWNLDRSWKLGDNWHRFAIDQNWPSLLDFPEEGGSTRTRRRASALYWVPQLAKKIPFAKTMFGKSVYKSVSYAHYKDWFRDDRVREFVLDHAPLLEELIDRRTVAAIVEENRATGDRTRAIAFLLSMAFWLQHVHEA